MKRVLQQAIYNYLTNLTDLTNVLGSGKITYRIAPADAQFPYLVFYEITEQSENYAKIDSINAVISMRVVSTSNSQVQQALDVIFDNLHNSASFSVTGWNVYRVKHINTTMFLEQQERVQVYMGTSDYRFTMNK